MRSWICHRKNQNLYCYPAFIVVTSECRLFSVKEYVLSCSVLCIANKRFLLLISNDLYVITLPIGICILLLLIQLAKGHYVYLYFTRPRTFYVSHNLISLTVCKNYYRRQFVIITRSA